jgi:rubredoxin
MSPQMMKKKYYRDSDDDSDNEWKLTDFEETREPIMPKENDDTLIKIHWADLASEMKCPVCLSLIKKTMITEVAQSD